MALIEREAALKALDDLQERSGYESDGWESGVASAYDCIAEQPTVDAVEVRHGRWEEDSGGYGYWICSCCRFTSEASCADVLYRYCPNCGAKMDEEDGDADGT